MLNFVKISSFATRITATSVETLYLEQTFEHLEFLFFSLLKPISLMKRSKFVLAIRNTEAQWDLNST